LTSNKNVFINDDNKVKEQHKKEGKIKMLLSKYIKNYLFDELIRYDDIEVISDKENVFCLFQGIKEPTNYLKSDMVEMLEFIKTTYAYEEDFIFDFCRDAWRFNNNYQKTNRSCGYYGKKGGEGKSFIGYLRSKIYKDYAKYNVSIGSISKEQTKAILKDTLYILFNELKSENSNSFVKIPIENIKRLNDPTILTRVMCGNEERI
jgi:hypothetical protein